MIIFEYVRDFDFLIKNIWKMKIHQLSPGLYFVS